MTNLTQVSGDYSMRDDIHHEFEDFAQFLTTIEPSNLSAYKENFFRKIDHIAELIEGAPNQKELEDEFFEMCGTIDSSLMHNRTREKPLGHAGDYQLIDWIYTGKTANSPRGKLFDLLFHSYEAAISVRNRKNYFIKKVIELSHTKKSRIDILNLGCGPCRDVLEAYETSQNGKNIYFHCIDTETQAIEYAKQLLAHTHAQDNVYFEKANVLRFRTDREYDMIWSAGLFDYLEDRVAIVLLKKTWKHLKKGGQIIFGNFSPKNPTRRGMELVGKWYLIHRSAQQLIAMTRNAGLEFSEIEVESEPMGINLFCIIKK